MGLEPGPSKDLVAANYGTFSIFAAEQPPSVWHRHTHHCTQITVAANPAFVRSEWTGSFGRQERRELNGDMVWIIPPDVPHAIYFERRAKLVHLYLTEEFFGSMIDDAPQQAQSSLLPSLLVRDSLLVELAKSVYLESRVGPFSKLFVQSIAAVTATHLLRSYSTHGCPHVYRGGLGAARERRLLAYIHEHLEQDLSLDELAKIATMSPNYLISLFRQSFGTTPHQFVLQLRAERARQLLRERKLSLS